MKRGQFSIFFVVGVLLVVGVGLTVFLITNQKQDELATQDDSLISLESAKSSVYEYVDSCLRKMVVEAAQKEGIRQDPMVEDLIETYIQDKLTTECIDYEALEGEGIHIDCDRTVASATLTEDSLDVRIDLPISFGEGAGEISEFYYNLRLSGPEIVLENPEGYITEDRVVNSEDGQFSLFLSEGTLVSDQATGLPAGKISVDAIQNTYPKIQGNILYEVKGDVQFSQPQLMKISYRNIVLPPDVPEENLVGVYLENGIWKMPISTWVDKTTKTVNILTDHASVWGIRGGCGSGDTLFLVAGTPGDQRSLIRSDVASGSTASAEWKITLPTDAGSTCIREMKLSKMFLDESLKRFDVNGKPMISADVLGYGPCFESDFTEVKDDRSYYNKAFDSINNKLADALQPGENKFNFEIENSASVTTPTGEGQGTLKVMFTLQGDLECVSADPTAQPIHFEGICGKGGDALFYDLAEDTPRIGKDIAGYDMDLCQYTPAPDPGPNPDADCTVQSAINDLCMYGPENDENYNPRPPAGDPWVLGGYPNCERTYLNPLKTIGFYDDRIRGKLNCLVAMRGVVGGAQKVSGIKEDDYKKAEASCKDLWDASAKKLIGMCVRQEGADDDADDDDDDTEKMCICKSTKSGTDFPEDDCTSFGEVANEKCSWLETKPEDTDTEHHFDCSEKQELCGEQPTDTTYYAVSKREGNCAIPVDDNREYLFPKDSFLEAGEYKFPYDKDGDEWNINDWAKGKSYCIGGAVYTCEQGLEVSGECNYKDTAELEWTGTRNKLENNYFIKPEHLTDCELKVGEAFAALKKTVCECTHTGSSDTCEGQAPASVYALSANTDCTLTNGPNTDYLFPGAKSAKAFPFKDDGSFVDVPWAAGVSYCIDSKLYACKDSIKTEGTCTIDGKEPLVKASDLTGCTSTDGTDGKAELVVETCPAGCIPGTSFCAGDEPECNKPDTWGAAVPVTQFDGQECEHAELPGKLELDATPVCGTGAGAGNLYGCYDCQRNADDGPGSDGKAELWKLDCPGDCENGACKEVIAGVCDDPVGKGFKKEDEVHADLSCNPSFIENAVSDWKAVAGKTGPYCGLQRLWICNDCIRNADDSAGSDGKAEMYSKECTEGCNPDLKICKGYALSGTLDGLDVWALEGFSCGATLTISAEGELTAPSYKLKIMETDPMLGNDEVWTSGLMAPVSSAGGFKISKEWKYEGTGFWDDPLNSHVELMIQLLDKDNTALKESGIARVRKC